MGTRALLLTVLLAAVASESAWARTIYVAADGTGDAPTLQAAVDLANPCDEIVVGPGRYTWDNQNPTSGFAMVFFAADVTALRIRSEMGAESTILDAQGQGRILHITGETRVRKCLDGRTSPVGVPQPLLIDGFTFLNGRAPEVGDYVGGAVAGNLSSAIVRNCVFRDNHADWRGGAYFWAGVGGPRVENCHFENNTAAEGGAIWIWKSLDPIEFVGNTFVNNRASMHGGALAAFHAEFQVVNCLFRQNRATFSGAAVYAQSVWPSVIKNSSMIENDSHGGIVRVVSDVDVEGRDIPESDVTVRSSVIAFNGLGRSVNFDFRGSLHIECTNIYGNRHGDWPNPLDRFLELALGNMAVEPLLCAAADDGRSVCRNSPLLATNNDCSIRIGARAENCAACEKLDISAIQLHANHPNPFNPSTTIAFELPEAAPVVLEVLDLRGRRVRLLEDRILDRGHYQRSWHGVDDAGGRVASGVYPLRLRVGEEIQMRSMVILR